MARIRDILRNRGIGILLYGPPGSGKTAALAGLAKRGPGKIFTCEGNGLRSLLNMGVEDVDFQIITSAQEWNVAVGEYLNKAPADHTWVAFDTVTSYYDLLWQDYFKTEKVDPKAIGFQIYNYCKAMFEAFYQKCVDLVDAGKVVILLCHQQLDCEEGVGKKESWAAPDLPGKLPDRLMRRLDLVLQARSINVGGKRSFRLLLPFGRDYGKDLFNCMSDPIVNDCGLLVDMCQAIIAKQGYRVVEVEDPIADLQAEAKERAAEVRAAKRGRPPGSKNKPKISEPTPPVAAPEPPVAAPSLEKSKENVVLRPVEEPKAAPMKNIDRRRLMVLYTDSLKAGWTPEKLQEEVKKRYGVEIAQMTDEQYTEMFLQIQDMILPMGDEAEEGKSDE